MWDLPRPGIEHVSPALAGGFSTTAPPGRGSPLKILKIELPYDPAIPLLGIYRKELKAGSQRDVCTPMFIAALFTIAKRWKQPTCPSVDERIKRRWYVCMYVMEYHAALKRKFCHMVQHR